MGESIRDHQPGHTGCGRSGEQCIQEGSALAGAGSEGEHQQQRTYGDQRQKAQ